MFFFGFALGPILGAWVIRNSDTFVSRVLHIDPNSGRTVVPVFAIAVIFWTISILLSAFVFPESLNKKRLKEADARADATAERVATENRSTSKTSARKGLLLPELRNVFMPLVVFAPRHRQNGKSKDWSMTLLALALFGYLLSSVSEQSCFGESVR